nr:MAG: ORF1 [TTV-like mini virus]
MPWNYRYYPKRWRRTRYRRWRFGNPIRRRYRRRWRRVRNFKPFKLKRLHIDQWQPPSIRKCSIKGLYCLAYINSKRLTHNSVMYEDSIVPEFQAGGGGFAVMKFTLYNLYDMHEKCENWWTNTNDSLPLCRYLGCTIKCYQSDTIDYVINYQNNGPFVSNKLSYPSCQPFMLMMNSHKHIIPSRQTKQWKKPYKILHIHPPDQFMNKWYFQKDICNMTLLSLHTAPCSLSHTFIDTQSESNNISIKHLNTTVFRNRDWGNKKWRTEHWPYKGEGTTATYFYRYEGTETQESKIKLRDICPLTDPQIASEGQTYDEMLRRDSNYTVAKYKENLLKYHRGNIFTKNHFTQQESIWYSTISPTALFKDWSDTNKDKTVAQAEQHPRSFLEFTENMYTFTRYNPNTDTGETTQMYLLDNNKTGVNYEPPQDETQILTGYPLWLNIFGFTDFQQKLHKYINQPQNTILVIQTRKTNPIVTTPIVVIDQDFIDGKSPYRPHIEPADQDKWYPQLQYQENSINDIGKCGPGIVKMGTRKSEEIKIKYRFRFKWGGNPAKMITVDNPLEQTIYPIPRNFNETPSLQSPASSFETILYTFDQRNHQLTAKALERIRKHIETKDPLLSITEPTTATTLQTLQELLQETQTEEESEKTLLLQLQQQRQQQLLLQQRIMELLQTMQT